MKYIVFVVGIFLVSSAFAANPYIGTWKGSCITSSKTKNSFVNWYTFASNKKVTTYTETFKDLGCLIPHKKTPEKKLDVQIKAMDGAYTFDFAEKDGKGNDVSVAALFEIKKDQMHITFQSSTKEGKKMGEPFSADLTKQK